MASIAAVSPLPIPGASLSRRERVALVVGAIAMLIFLIWFLSRSGGSGSPELNPSMPRPAPEAAIAVPVPEPSRATTVPRPSPTMPAAPGASGIRLDGIMARTAILSFSDGTQRWVPLGREFLPGFTLKALAVDHVIIASEGEDLRLELNRFGGLIQARPAASATMAVAANDNRGAPGPRTSENRFGLQPVKVNDRTSGYRITTAVRIPELRRAGMVAGDILLSVNGAQLDEERLMELSWTIANSERTEFGYSRNGRNLKTSFTK